MLQLSQDILFFKAWVSGENEVHSEVVGQDGARGLRRGEEESQHQANQTSSNRAWHASSSSQARNPFSHSPNLLLSTPLSPPPRRLPIVDEGLQVLQSATRDHHLRSTPAKTVKSTTEDLLHLQCLPRILAPNKDYVVHRVSQCKAQGPSFILLLPQSQS